MSGECETCSEHTLECKCKKGRCMQTEISVRIKSDDKTLKKKFLVYEDYNLDIHDPVIDRCLSETIREFGDTEKEKDISITAKLEL